MGFILTRVKQAIQTAADAVDDNMRIGYGDPAGSNVSVEGLGWYARGMSWAVDRGYGKGFLDLLLDDGLIKEMERSPEQFGAFSVGTSGVVPSIGHNDGLASVSKHENGVPPLGTCDLVTVTLDHAYKDNGYAVFVYFYNQIGIPQIYPTTATQFNISMYTHAGALIDLNGSYLGVLVKGNLV